VEQRVPGMFVNVGVLGSEQMEVVAVPLTAIMFATYGDSVFIVEPRPAPESGAEASPEQTGPGGEPVMVARQQFVQLGERRGDYVAVTKGVEVGQELVSEGAFKLRNNAPIYVDNTKQLTAQLSPQPKNR